MEIFTIGYEGTRFDEWIEHLMAHGITCLVDIREIPISRKRGFSKTSMRRSLEDRGIQYVHLKSLGSPSTIRRELHESNNYIQFFDDYDRYLDEHQNELDDLRELALNERICLLCFERNHRQCHRNSVARRLLSLMPEGASIVHVDCAERLARYESVDYRQDLSNTKQKIQGAGVHSWGYGVR